MDLIGYEGLYKIYPDGRIWGSRYKKIKKTFIGNAGYELITLCKDRKHKKFLVHRLLVQHFKPDIWKPELDVDHINGIRTDNRLENLRMVTHQENHQNQGMYKTNTSGHKNISYIKRCKLWQFQKMIAGNKYLKYFNTLDEALEFKKVFCVIHNIKDR
jgi:hypothetical protein